MLLTLSTIVYVIICLVLSVAILLQSSKGDGLGAGIGGGVATTEVFGGRGPGSSLRKVTIVCAIMYMALSAWLAYLSSKPQSALDLSQGTLQAASNEDPIVHEGTLKVNPDGSPLGSAPKANTPVVPKAPKPDATKTIKLAPPTTPKGVAPKGVAPKGVAPKGVAPKGVAPKTGTPPAAPLKIAPPKAEIPKTDLPSKPAAPGKKAPKIAPPKAQPTKTAPSK